MFTRESARKGKFRSRERKFFAIKRDAETYAKLHRIRVDNYGTAATLLSPGQLEEAAKAFRDLAPFNATLNEAVTEYVSRREQDGQSVTFTKLFELFTEAKATRSAARRSSATNCGVNSPSAEASTAWSERSEVGRTTRLNLFRLRFEICAAVEIMAVVLVSGD